MPLLRAARTVRPGMTDVIPGGASERRIITVLFCDVVSSTAMAERLDAELTALYLLRHEHKLETELYPEVAVGDGVRVPDFRVRSEEGVWIYVEVTQADTSEKQKRVEAIMGRLSAPVSRVKKSFALEVILEREPTGQELDELDGAIFELCQLEGEHRVGLPGLARLSVGGSPPGVVVAGSGHRAGDTTIRLGMAHAIRGPNEPHRHISVTIAFADERATKFLHDEAIQLPRDAPGLVMIDAAGPISLRDWEAHIEGPLQPKIHTRVGGVVLFRAEGGVVGGRGGLGLGGRLVLNKHAKLPLPAALVNDLTQTLNDGL